MRAAWAWTPTLCTTRARATCSPLPTWRACAQCAPRCKTRTQADPGQLHAPTDAPGIMGTVPDSRPCAAARPARGRHAECAPRDPWDPAALPCVRAPAALDRLRGPSAPPGRACGRAQVEQALLAAAPYPQFCLTAYNASAALGCAAPTSLLAFLYAPAAATTSGVVGYGADPAPGLAQAAAFMAADPAAFGFFFDAGFAPGNLTAAYVRSLVPLGAPLAGYASPADRCAGNPTLTLLCAALRAHACCDAPCRSADGRWVRPPCSRAAARPV